MQAELEFRLRPTYPKKSPKNFNSHGLDGEPEQGKTGDFTVFVDVKKISALGSFSSRYQMLRER